MARRPKPDKPLPPDLGVSRKPQGPVTLDAPPSGPQPPPPPPPPPQDEEPIGP